jgi:membrane associated rhomboid family serine protease
MRFFDAQNPGQGAATPSRRGAPPVTIALAAALTAVTVARLIWPGLEAHLGSTRGLIHPWQPFTCALVHGWPGLPAPVHLVGNLILLGMVGPATERWLGSTRYLVLTGAAIAVAGVTQLAGGVQVNGASVFIWAYAPVVWYGMRRRPLPATRRERSGEMLPVALIVMWFVIPLLMGFSLAVGGVPPWRAVLVGNLYHATATVVGFAGVAAWRHVVASRAVVPP